jgi:hypothetical protein
MAVISRIMWTAADGGQTPEELLNAAARAIAPWAMESQDLALPDSGEITFERSGATNPGIRTVRAHMVDDPAGLVVEVEDDDGTGAVWGVHMRLAVSDGQLHAWVDNTLESDTVAIPVSVGRPRVVDSLLAVGTKPRLGASALLSDVQDIPASAVEVLKEHLLNPDRGLPVVVMSCSWTGFDDHDRSRAANLAKRLTGLATVVMLDSTAQDALKEALPPRLGVWGGAARVYAPGTLDSPAAHRLYGADLLRQRGVDPVVNWVTSLSSRRRPDQRLRAVVQATSGTDARAAVAQVEALRLERDQVQIQLENEIIERAELEAELNKALVLARRLRQLGFETGMTQQVLQAEHDAEEAGEALLTVSEAVERARKELSEYLAIPEGADRDLDGVDATPNALAWGNTVWRGLSALSDYSRDVRIGAFSGGFWNWCVREGSWPATTKKLAMSESETVENNTKLSSKRYFQVDMAIDGSGQIFMGAHLKISEGGGNLAPRVYFHDDTAGSTKRVHVGFVGPHYLVPNTKS